MCRKAASRHKKNFLFSEPFDSNLLIWGSPVYAFPTNKHVLLCNQNRIIKIRKSTPICYYHWILRHIHIWPYVSKIPFIAKEFSSESWVAFHSRIFLVSLTGPIPQSSLYFHYLDTFEDYKPITLYCVLWYAFVSCFPIIRFKLFILSRISQRWCCVHVIGWYSLIFSLWSLEWDDVCHVASPLQSYSFSILNE